MTWLNSAAVCERYNISPRTLYRWTAQCLLPEPVRFNSRKFWSVEQLDKLDQARLAVSQPTAREMLDSNNSVNSRP
jgi:DNA-binding transcriptional MerR regulator